MQSTLNLLRQRVTAAIVKALDLDQADVNPLLTRIQDEQFGDYQSNCAMALAKRMGSKPHDVARRIVNELHVDDISNPPEIKGPGFINFRLSAEFIAAQLAAIPPAPADGRDRLGIPTTDRPTIVAVDMSSPNLAKEMHVGHLRSTIIGDCVARILEFEGHRVHRINHVGDWGTQFGMLLAYLRRTQPGVLDNPDDLHLDDLEQFYVQAKKLYDADPDFAETSRKTVVELQGRDPEVMAVWRAFCDESLRHCRGIFHRLNVTVVDRGESFYNDMLPDVVKRFQDKGLATDSEGAVCIFLDGFTSRDGSPLPIIIRKSDGGYNYDTTDLAAIYHRIEELGARRLIYVVGMAQKQHFDMLFAAARKIGWACDDVELTHLGFGNLLGPNGRPFKTSSGGNVKLKDLLDQAVKRARSVIESSSQTDSASASDGNVSNVAPPLVGGAPGVGDAPLVAGARKRADFDEATITAVADAVGIGAVKYFDLSHSLLGDYKFDWDTMLSLEGNTAPYMLYAYARIHSIARKAGIRFADLPHDTRILLDHPSELRLAKTLLRFCETIDKVAADLRPNVLTDYLFELSKAYSLFYDRVHGVRIIDASPETTRLSRLRLCDLTARTLKLGLHLLGIRTVEQM